MALAKPCDKKIRNPYAKYALIQERVLILAMGTEIQKHAIPSWETNAKAKKLDGCSEALNRFAPEVIQAIHTSCLQAGANILKTNTFGVMPLIVLLQCKSYKARILAT